MTARPSMDSVLRDMLSEFFGYVDDERRLRSLDPDDVHTLLTGMHLGDLSKAYSSWRDQVAADDPLGDVGGSDDL